MIFSFLFCWTPYALVCIYQLMGGSVTPYASAFPVLFCKSSICANPFIYVAMNSQVCPLIVFYNQSHLNLESHLLEGRYPPMTVLLPLSLCQFRNAMWPKTMGKKNLSQAHNHLRELQRGGGKRSKVCPEKLIKPTQSFGVSTICGGMEETVKTKVHAHNQNTGIEDRLLQKIDKTEVALSC